jgi:hypothetical protein
LERIRRKPSQVKNLSLDQGPMLCFFKYFRRKIRRKMAFLTQKKLNYAKN